ncbi:MAG: bifunctional UDP-N-acetylmuramoyl-tripeptide:D-alanyl-D-alanine ligase/alanine racemase [Bacteroidota bacterium]|nr:bifunctional UDP-N-acetylmuramoyl-tripeptide:D-alanyl-D-alanine ligase/alanine racemase [Bacteroidota bacterium]
MNAAINYTVEQLANYTGGKLIVFYPDIPQPAYLSLDSRKILFPGSTIFFAINTPHKDGHEFIENLYQRGVRNFLIEEGRVDLKKIPGANVIGVKNTLHALQSLAEIHRAIHDTMPGGGKFPVIGITGSNGKTIVKEWLAHLLEDEYSIVRSPRSYNSQIGVPLSVLNINSSNTLSIFEAGISTVGEMSFLEKMIKPTIGVLTNIGHAHDKGFKNKTQKINEKLLLFKNSDHLIFSGNDKEIKNEVIAFKKSIKNENDHLKLFSWGKKTGNDLQIVSVIKNKNSTSIEGIYQAKNYTITIPFVDDASVENAVTCWCVLIILNKNAQKITDRFTSLYPIAMRLELKQGINHCTLINDSYSNDLHSLSMALDFLAQQKQHKKHTVILSDILQSGMKPHALYVEVASLFKQKKVRKLIGIGPELFFHQKEFSSLEETHFFLTLDDFLKSISPLHFHDENILVKGARIFGFEQIVVALEQKVHQTVLSINLNAIVHNLKQYKQLLLPTTKIMGMVKAFSYGSGSYEIASVLEFNKIDYLAVAYADEGVELRKAGINVPIMVMNIEISTFASLINYNLEPEIFSFSILHEFENFLKLSGAGNYPVHIKIDTGMHRLGFTSGDIKKLATHLSSNSFLKVMTVFTHLVASEDEKHDLFTQQQVRDFQDCAQKLEEATGYPFYKHVANTSAISRHPGFQMDMVRLGIGLYGVDNNNAMHQKLQNVTTLTTTISQVKKVRAGDTVGYGRNAQLERDSTIATVRIGYADGYPRNLGNGKGKMLFRNKLVSVVGNVCMDMTMLDVTGFESVQEGEPVIVFGESLPLSMLAMWAETIPYEIMTGISQRVKRVYFEE